jgi:flagella basal body P-ring formation protein FlgA
MWKIALLALLPQTLWAESLVATRTIRAQSVIGPADVAVVADGVPGAVTQPDMAVGQEARVTIYAGRPILVADLGAPAVIDRNQTVQLGFMAGGLRIWAEGRALARGSVGDVIRVMNVSSRTTVTGRIASDGTVIVGVLQ